MLLGRGYQAMERAFTQVIERLPFAVKELHPDNGTEFFNDHLVRFWKEKVKNKKGRHRSCYAFPSCFKEINECLA